MGGGYEETGGGRYDDGDEGCRLLLIGDQGVYQGEGVRKQGYRHDQIGSLAHFLPPSLLLIL